MASPLTLGAIDFIIQHGALPQWMRLHAAARGDAEVLHNIRAVCEAQLIGDRGSPWCAGHRAWLAYLPTIVEDVSGDRLRIAFIGGGGIL